MFSMWTQPFEASTAMSVLRNMDKTNIPCRLFGRWRTYWNMVMRYKGKYVCVLARPEVMCRPKSCRQNSELAKKCKWRKWIPCPKTTRRGLLAYIHRCYGRTIFRCDDPTAGHCKGCPGLSRQRISTKRRKRG